MKLIFVHGWSVTNTNTYGELPQALANKAVDYDLEVDIQHVYLGRYISFHDEVTVDDIARALNKALEDLPGNSKDSISTFSCITHSTGGPVVRYWVERYYGADNLECLPLKHLVMLAPANHGSALAKLGKARVGRIKSWFSGIEPGQGVLDWLCLGSDGQWQLNEQYLTYNYAKNGLYPFVLTGQGIDHSFYDFLNSYLVEKGSDGVVRVSGASLNYQYISLKQNVSSPTPKRKKSFLLELDGEIRESTPVAIGVYNDRSHSGEDMGIMRSITADGDDKVVLDILKCFKVDDEPSYIARADDLSQLTHDEQQNGGHYCMLVFNICDDQGERIKENDFDLFLLSGSDYSPDCLPKGFFMDRQMNSQTGRLIYYLDADKMKNVPDGKLGFRVVARPQSGFSYYCEAEFHSDQHSLGKVIQANEVTYVNIILHRFVDEEVFRFDSACEGAKSFKDVEPSGEVCGE